MQAQGSMIRFQDIVVMPSHRLYFHGLLTDGGPVWPDFDSQTIVRHHRRGRPVDMPAPLPRSQPSPVATPCVWGGFVQPHFGHLIADHLTRIVTALQERPDDTYLFTLLPGPPKGPDGPVPDGVVPDGVVPAYFWSIIDWYGLPRAQVRFVTEPLLVRDLCVAAQAEQVHGTPPAAGYLDRLAVIARRNALVPVASDRLYISRAGLLAQGKGGNAAEAYLVDCLTRLDVQVLDPQRSPLDRQLALYAGSEHLIFSEGSALHGRQLLGRIDQDISILNRRPDSKTARAALAARCTRLTYLEVTGRIAIPARQDGRPMDAMGIGFYDLPALFASFQTLGVDLQQVWNGADYTAMRDADITAWLRALADKPARARAGGLARRLMTRRGLAPVRAVFAAEGLGDPLRWPLRWPLPPAGAAQGPVLGPVMGPVFGGLLGQGRQIRAAGQGPGGQGPGGQGPGGQGGGTEPPHPTAPPIGRQTGHQTANPIGRLLAWLRKAGF